MPHLAFCSLGTEDNRPAIYRWLTGILEHFRVPGGRPDQLFAKPYGSIVPPGLMVRCGRFPGNKLPGYYLASLRDYGDPEWLPISLSLQSQGTRLSRRFAPGNDNLPRVSERLSSGYESKTAQFVIDLCKAKQPLRLQDKGKPCRSSDRGSSWRESE